MRSVMITVACVAFFTGCALIPRPVDDQTHPAHRDASPGRAALRERVLASDDAARLVTGATRHSRISAQPPVAHSTAYVCPMHPEVTQEQPGGCPQCGMQLERREGWTR